MIAAPERRPILDIDIVPFHEDRTGAIRDAEGNLYGSPAPSMMADPRPGPTAKSRGIDATLARWRFRIIEGAGEPR